MTQAVKTKPQFDYSALGLKCGLELHQQLETGRKLFCHCKTDLRLDEPQVTITRHMRPTLSELGEYDKAALMEFKKKKEIIYQIHDSVCSYEIDETPPFDPDPNAVDLAITIARLLQMDILDELHVNRKQYLDGSIPTGFQRTMIVGIGGKVKAAGKTINLDMLALEEDSCREISNIGRTITWRVDRLGTPLIEIATKTITISDPDEIKLIAEGIGRILRSTGKVKRGLGTIRQDLNISIEKGARIEVKGVQVLDMLPVYVTLEVERQLALLQIKELLEKKKLTAENFIAEFKDCKEVFMKTSSKMLIEAINEKKQILGVKLPGMKGILSKKIQAEKTFGKELAERVKVITGLGGILHTDELINYGVKEEEIASLCKFFKCKSTDAVVVVSGNKEDTISALSEIMIRVKEIFTGVPEETRHANEDGTTSFRRYLGGAGRMYPDTDSYPIIVTQARINRIEEGLPELPDKKEERYIRDLNLPEEIAKELAISPRADLFDELIKAELDPMLVAVTLEQTLKALARDAIPIESITDNKIKDIFSLLKNKRIAKEAIEPLLKHLAENPKDKIDTTLEFLGLELISEEKLSQIIDEVFKINLDFIKENGQRALGKLMGHVMEQVRGKIDGKIVSDTLNKKFKAKLVELGITT
ncbi:MAG: Glu-tRNA(Gln) amidotransferase subunit GatE [Candidatus Heimdallarchaeota archaeon]|nr:Glu-tRNA(Gln) amidotransferase subunit GatE [Candidatus Heimdallarchaeota archaeon]